MVLPGYNIYIHNHTYMICIYLIGKYIYIHSHTCLYNVFISLLIFQPHILILWSSKFLSHVKPPWIPAFLNRCRGSRTCTCLAILSSTTPCPLPFVRVERALEFDKNPDPSQRIFTDFSDIIPRAKKNPGIRLPYRDQAGIWYCNPTKNDWKFLKEWIVWFWT